MRTRKLHVNGSMERTEVSIISICQCHCDITGICCHVFMAFMFAMYFSIVALVNYTSLETVDMFLLFLLISAIVTLQGTTP